MGVSDVLPLRATRVLRALLHQKHILDNESIAHVCTCMYILRLVDTSTVLEEENMKNSAHHSPIHV